MPRATKLTFALYSGVNVNLVAGCQWPLRLRLWERDPDLDIRRPDLRGVGRLGTVRWFKDEKGYGRVTADDGEVLFVSFSAIVGEGFGSLEEGERVSFVWNGYEGDHGRHAADEVRREAT